LIPKLQAALPAPGHPDYAARKAELEQLVEAAGPERALHAYRWLDGDEEHRATQVDVFVEACTWHPDAPTFGGALSLARELPLDSPQLPERMSELERLVAASNPEIGLLAYRELGEENREEQIGQFVEICSWNPNLGRFGTASKVLRLVREWPEAMPMVRALDWGDDWLSCDAALQKLPELEQTLRETERLTHSPVGQTAETEDHWLIGGTVLRKSTASAVPDRVVEVG
jgi:hypothetical protein